jgi:hypothetical protein
LFVLLRGGLQSIPKFLSDLEIKFLYRFLQGLALSGAIILPFMLGLSRNIEGDSLPPPRTNGVLSGAAFLFAGGLSILASMDVALALVTIFVSIFRLSGSYGLHQIAPEENLVRSLSIVYRDSMGFAIFFCCITGLVVAAEVLGLGTFATFGLTSLYVWKSLPLINVLSLGALIVCVLGAVASFIGFLRMPRFDMNGLCLSFILVSSLWTICAAVLLFGSEWGIIPPPTEPFAHYIYPISLATGLVIVEAIRVKTGSLFWYLTAVIGFCTFLAALLIHPTQVRLTLILEFALLGYWSGPLLEWFGRSV